MQQQAEGGQHFRGRLEHAGDQQQVAHSVAPPLASAVAPSLLV
jgi:hypothetical protein